MTVPLETDITVAGVGRLKIEAGGIRVAFVTLSAVIHTWLDRVKSDVRGGKRKAADRQTDADRLVSFIDAN